MTLLSVQLYSPTKRSALTVHYTWPLTSAKTWCPCSLDTLVNTSVFCADLRLELGGKTKAGLWTAPQTQWDTRPPEVHFNRAKVLKGVGTIGLLGF